MSDRRLCLWIAAALIALFASGCKKNEFKVETELPGSVSGHYSLLYYASDPVKGWFAEEMLMVEKGKGTVVGRTHNPSLVWILDGSGRPASLFYAQRGDEILLKGDNDNPATWSISGNKKNERLSAWFKTNRGVISSRDAAKINKAVADYVAKNPEDPVSTILVTAFFDRRIDEAGFARLWKQLRGVAKEERWVDLVSRADISAGGPWMRKMPRSVVIKSAGNGADTLDFGRHPAILYFNRGECDGRREAIETLKKLTRDYPDSASRIIAEISVEPDSMSRVWPMRTDSLRKAVKGWMPMGPSDIVATQLGVEEIPLFVVIGKGGKELYHGADVAAAETAFKKGMTEAEQAKKKEAEQAKKKEAEQAKKKEAGKAVKGEEKGKKTETGKK